MNSAVQPGGDTRKQKTRDALHAAMLEILAEKPFDQIQILELTNRAQVGYATFFRHYAGTVDVLDEVAGDEIADLLAMTIPVFRQSENATSLQALCRYISERRALWHTLLTGGAAERVRSEFVRQALEWSHREGGGEDLAVPMDLGTTCAAGSTIDALAWWLDKGQVHTPEAMAGFIYRLCIYPFVGKP